MGFALRPKCVTPVCRYSDFVPIRNRNGRPRRQPFRDEPHTGSSKSMLGRRPLGRRGNRSFVNNGFARGRGASGLLVALEEATELETTALLAGGALGSGGALNNRGARGRGASNRLGTTVLLVTGRGIRGGEAAERENGSDGENDTTHDHLQ